MANKILGNGVTVVGASYTSDNKTSGIYTNGDTVSFGVTPADSGVILATGHATDFINSSKNANQSVNASSKTHCVNNAPGFCVLGGPHTYGDAMLDADFMPTGDILTMQFVLSSEKYPEYCSQYIDTIGVWSNGPKFRHRWVMDR